jgi:hypothetical protein
MASIVSVRRAVDPTGRLLSEGRERVLDELGRDDVIGHVHPARIEDLFDPATNKRLVGLAHDDPPSLVASGLWDQPAGPRPVLASSRGSFTQGRAVKTASRFTSWHTGGFGASYL